MLLCYRVTSVSRVIVFPFLACYCVTRFSRALLVLLLEGRVLLVLDDVLLCILFGKRVTWSCAGSCAGHCGVLR